MTNPNVRASVAEVLVRQAERIAAHRLADDTDRYLQLSKSSGQKFDKVFLIDTNGSVVVSTDPGHEGYLLFDQPFFSSVKKIGTPAACLRRRFDDQPVIFAAARCLITRRCCVASWRAKPPRYPGSNHEQGTGLGESRETYLVAKIADAGLARVRRIGQFPVVDPEALS